MPRRGEQLIAEVLVRTVLAALQRRDRINIERKRQGGAAPAQHGDQADTLHACILGARAAGFLTKIKSASRGRPIVAL